MYRSLSWIDPHEWEALVHSAGLAGSKRLSSEAGVSGTSSSPQRTATENAGRAWPQIDLESRQEAELLAPPLPTPPRLPATPQPTRSNLSTADGSSHRERTSLSDRLAGFADHLMEASMASGVFIADASGLEIYNGGTDAGYVAVSGELLKQLQNVVMFTEEHQPQQLVVRWAGGKLLNLVEARHGEERYVVGIVSQRPLDQPVIIEAQTKLIQLLDTYQRRT